MNLLQRKEVSKSCYIYLKAVSCKLQFYYLPQFFLSIIPLDLRPSKKKILVSRPESPKT